MKDLFKSAICLLLLSYANYSWGATTATATVTYTISSISAITVSGNPGALNITSATAGSALPTATDTSTTYAVTTNASAQKVTGALTTNMPSGVTLAVTLAAPTGGTSAGAVNLTNVAQSLVTGITDVAQAGLQITYALSASLTATPVAAATNTVTYTIGP